MSCPMNFEEGKAQPTHAGVQLREDVYVRAEPDGTVIFCDHANGRVYQLVLTQGQFQRAWHAAVSPDSAHVPEAVAKAFRKRNKK